MRVRFAPSPTGPAARRQRAHGALQLAAGARHGRHVHPAHRGHRRRAIDARVRARPSSTTCGGWGSTGTKASRPAATHGPYRQSERLHIYRAHAVELLSRGARLSLLLLAPSSSRPIGRRRSPRAGRRSTSAAAATSRATRRGGASRTARRPSIRFRVPDDRDVVFDDVVRGEVRFNTERHRRSGARALRRRARLQLRRRHRRCADGDHARGPRRGSHLEHAAADAALRGVRLDAAGVRARLAGDGAGSRAAVEAARRDVGGRVPRARLPAGGADELPGAASAGRPARARSCCRSTSWRARFRLEDVGHSAGVFDVEKLAWVNRHYLKAAVAGAAGATVGAVPAAARDGWREPTPADLEFLAQRRAAGGGVGRSARPGAGAAAVPVRLLGGARARRSGRSRAEAQAVARR